MTYRRAFLQTVILVIVCTATGAALQTQPDPALEEGKRLFELLRNGKADDVAAQFNAKMAAAISADQLKQLWPAVEQQAGKFDKVIDERVDTPAGGFKAITLGCQFEKAVAEFQVVFDAEKKIAGLRITPRRQ